jgi:hypothetical protein
MSRVYVFPSISIDPSVKRSLISFITGSNPLFNRSYDSPHSMTANVCTSTNVICKCERVGNLLWLDKSFRNGRVNDKRIREVVREIGAPSPEILISIGEVTIPSSSCLEITLDNRGFSGTKEPL